MKKLTLKISHWIVDCTLNLMVFLMLSVLILPFFMSGVTVTVIAFISVAVYLLAHAALVYLPKQSAESV